MQYVLLRLESRPGNINGDCAYRSMAGEHEIRPIGHWLMAQKSIYFIISGAINIECTSSAHYKPSFVDTHVSNVLRVLWVKIGNNEFINT